jgi:NAD(P)-dependent dehydrogenase (short-subunit alcohol dehydrogenase family)
MQLAGKKVVVVGGSSGIGPATAEPTKHESAEVVIASAAPKSSTRRRRGSA